MRRKMPGRRYAVLQATLQILRRDAIGIVWWRPECDGEVVVHRVKEKLDNLVKFCQWAKIGTHLDVVLDVPFHHDHFQDREYNHEIPRVFLSSHEIHNTNQGNIPHITKYY